MTSVDYSSEVSLRKALLDACIKAKKCLNVQQLWEASQELLLAKDALMQQQKAERELEVKEAEKMVCVCGPEVE